MSMNECLYIFVWKAAEFFYLHDHVLFLLIPKIFLKLSKVILLALIPVSLKTYTIIPSPGIQSPPSSSKYCYVFFFFFWFLLFGRIFFYPTFHHLNVVPFILAVFSTFFKCEFCSALQQSISDTINISLIICSYPIVSLGLFAPVLHRSSVLHSED